MRLLLFLITYSLAVTAKGSDSDVWRPPQPIPAHCPNIQLEVLLVDVSGSMKQGGLFERVQQSIANRVRREIPACTLEILASFGVTSDVNDAVFLDGPDGREKLANSVKSLRPTHVSTNLDEAAKLVELLSYQLRAAYGTPANRLVVRIYSDFVSSPSSGKPKFSLGQYLARRMNAEYLRVSPGELPAEQTIQVQTAQAAGTDLQTEGNSKGSKAKVAAVVAGGALLLLGLVLLLWVRSRSSALSAPQDRLGALLVTESTESLDAGAAEVLSTGRRIDVATGVPAVFSTDPICATYVAAAISGAASGELFRIEPLPDGLVRVQSPHPRLTVNDEPLDVDRRLKISLRESIRIRLGRREFSITGVFEGPGSFRHESDVFDAEALRD